MNYEKIDIRRQKKVDKYTRLLYTALNKQLRQFMSVFKTVNILDVQTLIAYIDETPIKDVYVKLYKEAGISEFKNLSDYMLKPTNKALTLLNDIDDYYLQQLEKFALTEAGVRLTWMTEETRQLILRTARGVIQEGTNQGLGIEKITKNLEKELAKKYKETARWRARRIAQTEVIGASNKGAFFAANNLGIELKKRWLKAPLGIAKTERHALLDIPDVDLNKPFFVDGEALMYPGDPVGSAGNIINCRCSISFIPTEKLTDL